MSNQYEYPQNVNSGALTAPTPKAALLTMKDFCVEYRQSRSIAYELLASGVLKGVKVGRRTFICREDAEDWRKSLPAYSTSKE